MRIEPVVDPVSEELAREAAVFCAFVERLSELPVVERLVATRDRLLALYAAALQLPSKPDAGGDVELPERAVPSGVSFEGHDAYWEVYDPAEETVVGASLSDDVLDTYRDVARGLDLWNAGYRTEAIWQWRFHLDVHWGNHTIDALRALHWAINRVRAYQ